MKIKATAAFFAAAVSSLMPGAVYADAEAPAASAVAHLVQPAAGFVFFLSVVIIVIGGFKFLISKDRYMEHERAKGLIVQGALSAFASLFVFVVAKAAKNARQTLNLGKTVGATAIGLLIAVGLVYLVYTLFKIKKAKAQIKSLANEISEGSEKQNESGVDAIAAQINVLEREVGRSRMEQPLEARFMQIIGGLRGLVEKMGALDHETRFAVEESLTADMRRLIEAYSALRVETKESYKEKLAESLNKIEEKVRDVYTKLEQKNVNGLEIAMGIIDEKYK